MRKFLLLSIPLFLVFLLSDFDQVERNDFPPKLVGSWEYSAPAIGFKYQKGALKFSLEQNVLKGYVVVEDKIIPLRNLIYEEDKVRAHIMVEGQQFDIFLRFQLNSFKGTVSYPQGYIRVSGSKTLL